MFHRHMQLQQHLQEQQQQNAHHQQQQEEVDPHTVKQQEIISTVQQFLDQHDLGKMIRDSAGALRQQYQQQQQGEEAKGGEATDGAEDAAPLTDEQLGQVRQYAEHLLVIASNMFLVPSGAGESDVSSHVSQFFKVFRDHVPLLRYTLAQLQQQQQHLPAAVVDAMMRLLQMYESIDAATGKYCRGVLLWGYTGGADKAVQDLYSEVAHNDMGTATTVHRALAYNELSGVYLQADVSATM